MFGLVTSLKLSVFDQKGTNVDEKLRLNNAMIIMVYMKYSQIFNCFSLINSFKWRGKEDNKKYFAFC